jgi:hypothetical protein
MSQIFTDDCYSGSHQAGIDLQAFEDNFAALKSMFSGGAAPANLVAGMHWFDTTKKALKMRNSLNAVWLGIMQADASHKIWVYRNTAPDGWAIDSSVVDVILALKGGTQAYNANGGTQAGTWTQPTGNADLATHTHTSPTVSLESFKGAFPAGEYDIPNYIGAFPEIYNNQKNFIDQPVWTAAPGSYYRVNNGVIGNAGSGDGHNHGITYRPAAAIGTLQYLDL